MIRIRKSMLRITVELVPFGDEINKKKIGEMVLANTGSNEDGTCSYSAWTEADSHSEPAMFGKIKSFNRTQSVWELLRLMLEAIRLEKHEPVTDELHVDQRLKNKLGSYKKECDQLRAGKMNKHTGSSFEDFYIESLRQEISDLRAEAKKSKK